MLCLFEIECLDIGKHNIDCDEEEHLTALVPVLQAVGTLLNLVLVSQLDLQVHATILNYLCSTLIIGTCSKLYSYSHQ